VTPSEWCDCGYESCFSDCPQERLRRGGIRGAFLSLGMVGVAFQLVTNAYSVGTHERHVAAADRRFQRMRDALIRVMWNAVADDESCGGDCEEDGEPFAVCQAMRALGWGEHFTVERFTRRAP